MGALFMLREAQGLSHTEGGTQGGRAFVILREVHIGAGTRGSMLRLGRGTLKGKRWALVILREAWRGGGEGGGVRGYPPSCAHDYSAPPLFLPSSPSITEAGGDGAVGDNLAPIITSLHSKLMQMKMSRLLYGAACEHVDDLANMQVQQKVGMGAGCGGMTHGMTPPSPHYSWHD